MKTAWSFGNTIEPDGIVYIFQAFVGIIFQPLTSIGESVGLYNSTNSVTLELAVFDDLESGPGGFNSTSLITMLEDTSGVWDNAGVIVLVIKITASSANMVAFFILFYTLFSLKIEYE